MNEISELRAYKKITATIYLLQACSFLLAGLPLLARLYLFYFKSEPFPFIKRRSRFKSRFGTLKNFTVDRK